jgi:hypothetical protein
MWKYKVPGPLTSAAVLHRVGKKQPAQKNPPNKTPKKRLKTHLKAFFGGFIVFF